MKLLIVGLWFWICKKAWDAFFRRQKRLQDEARLNRRLRSYFAEQDRERLGGWRER